MMKQAEPVEEASSLFDMEAFEQVLLSYAEMCYSVALALTGNPGQAHDLARHVLAQAWHQRDRADGGKDLKKKLLEALRERFLHILLPGSVPFQQRNNQYGWRGHTMYCPECKAEYRERFMRCSDCNVDLVDYLPQERVLECENLVTVFEGDSNSAAAARTAVEGVGIKSWIKDEEIHGLFPSLGATEIMVCVEDEETALEALETP